MPKPTEFTPENLHQVPVSLRDEMSDTRTPAKFAPESLGYLPAYFREEVSRENEQPVTWLLEAFEANVHLVERMIEKSRMLFDPEQVSQFPGRVRSPALSARDLADLPSLACKLDKQEDKVSKFLWGHLPKSDQEAVSHYASSKGDSEPIQRIIVHALNKLILGPPIDDPVRFAEVKFSKHTRRLRALDVKNASSARLNRLLLQDAYPREILAMPETQVLDEITWEAAWLQWLASVICLDLDQEWLGELGAANADGKSDPKGPPSAKAAAAIKKAAVLYRKRGTPGGLTDLLLELYGWDIEIAERSWPKGMEIGRSSVGIDTWLVDELDPDRQFTVLIKPTEPNLSRLGLSQLKEVSGRIEFELAGKARGRRIESFLTLEGPEKDRAVPIPLDVQSAERMDRAITQLRDLLDCEKPAHTRYYLALEAPVPQTAEPKLGPLVIGIESIIGNFWIN